MEIATRESTTHPKSSAGICKFHEGAASLTRWVKREFADPGHTLGNPDFNVISTAKAARTVQLALRILF